MAGASKLPKPGLDMEHSPGVLVFVEGVAYERTRHGDAVITSGAYLQNKGK